MTIYENQSLEQNNTKEENFESLLEEFLKDQKKEGEIVTGKVVGISNDAILVDVGLKSEGRIPINEFINDDNEKPEFTIGEEIEVFIERFDGRNGETVLSRGKALKEEAWLKFEDFYKKGINVEGSIIGRVKGGFAVDLGGIIAFLPGSQLDIRPVKDILVLIDVEQPFKILKMNREQGNVVVSRKAILEESRKEAKNELLSSIKEGLQLKGVVKNITDYGAFVDLGAMDGLLHITDISWKKVSHPSEYLTLGQEINVVIIKYNPETQRVSLGLKQLEKNPWDGYEKKYNPGTKLKGVVSSITDYGVFVELSPDVEGLVYHTEISWNAKNMHPSKLVKVGEEVDIIVLEVDIEKHRISLSMKQCNDNPWEQFARVYPIGTKVKGIVKKVADFGLFITIAGEEEKKGQCISSNLDVLIPAVEINWDDNPRAALSNYKEGDEVEGLVLTIDIERERITVSIKQLQENTSVKMVKRLLSSYAVTCIIKEILKDALILETVEGGVPGVLKKYELSKHKEQQNPERFEVGDRLDAKAASYDKTTRMLNFSVKALEIEEEKKAIAEYGSADSGASLGDILGAALKENNKK